MPSDLTNRYLRSADDNVRKAYKSGILIGMAIGICIQMVVSSLTH